MFDLETAISEWRSHMGAAGLSPEAVAELESHLRERIAVLKAGLSERDAFQTAASQVGDSKSIKREFSKIHNRSSFHRDNPWPLHVLSALYAFWWVVALHFFVIAPRFYLGFARHQLDFLPKLLFIFVAFGLLRRQNFWRLYAIFVTAFNCLNSALAFGYHGFVWKGNAWNLLPVFNIVAGCWAVYVLTRPSVRALFTNSPLSARLRFNIKLKN
jgi:hypothetical protein